jgi:hypothetical protein
VVIGIALTIGAAFARAEDSSLTDLQLMFSTESKDDPGNGTGTSNKDLTFLRAEHYGTWSYGNNYIDLDLFMGDQVGGKGAGSFGRDASRQYYFLYEPRISLGKLLGHISSDVFTQQDLLFDAWAQGKLQLGTRLEYHSARDYSRFTPYAMLKWTF